MTNILATIIVCVTTNVYQPTQYLYNSYGCLVYGCTADHSKWVDEAPGRPVLFERPTRKNPDVRITEIREVKTVRFELDGREYAAEISDVVISSKRERRTVATQDTWSVEP